MAQLKDSLITGDLRVTGTIYGNLSGNATSATKLQTARTIWGQSFNGTANITGDLVDVGTNIKAISGVNLINFLTSAGGALNGKFGRIGLSSSYSSTDLSTYTFDVNGVSCFQNHVWLRYATPNLYIKDTSTATNTYSIIRFGNSSNDNAAYIFLNGPSRTDDGGVNMFTIRNNVGNLRLNNNTFNTGVLTVGSTLDTNYKLRVDGNAYITGPLRIGNSDTAANTGYATENVGSTNYIAFYGVYGDNAGGFNHTYIGESIYGSKTTANEQSELLLFHGNDPGTGSGPDRIRLFAGQVDIQVYASALSGTWDAIRATAGTQVANFSSAGLKVGTTSSGGIGLANTSPTTGTGISLYSGPTATGLPTYGLAFAGTATFGTHGGVTSDWATYFTMSDTTNRGWIFRRGSTNVASIDGTGKIYLGYPQNASNPGIYWNPYVESATDSSDAAGIYQIKSGVAGGTELRINQMNDAGDVVNITTNAARTTLRHNNCIIPDTANQTGTVGSASQPVYINAGAITAITGTIGSGERGVYFNNGTITSLSYYPRSVGVNSGNTNNYPWHRVATTNMGTGSWVDKDTILCIRQRFDGGKYGIIKISARTNNATTDPPAAMSATATWIIRRGFEAGDVRICRKGLSGQSNQVDVYVKCTSYMRSLAYFMEGWNNGWTLVASNEVNDTTTSDKKTSSEVWADITTTSGATAYDTITVATDGAHVNSANNATNIYSSASTAKAYVLGTTTASSANHATVYNASVYTQNSVLYGAAWNDYAEYRKSEILEPGRCVYEVGDDTLAITTERLMGGCEIISDTYGFAIGETDDCQTPIAASGRVLAYPYEDRNTYKPGDAVCSGPNGTVSKMTDEEIIKYPHKIIGTVSCVPDYDEWGTGKVKVDGRIWIRIR